MLKTAPVVPEDQHFVFSSLPPGPTQKRLALAVVVGVMVAFALITFGPLKGAHVGRVDAFVPAYVMAMFVFDSITAILLYAQFSILRSRALLVIASGYVFTALILIPGILVFPGVFAPGRGLFGGLQTATFVWLFWHAGFPLFVIGYALLKDADSSRRSWRGSVRAQIAVSVALTAAAVSVVAFVCIAGEALLPRVASDTLHFSSLWPFFIGAPVAAANVSAFIVLWARRHSMLDLWLIVVICLYLIETPLTYYPDPSRFSLAWYTVRVIGFFASGLVLIGLLYEITTLYSKRAQAERLKLEQRLRQAEKMEAIGRLAGGIAHDFNNVLGGIFAYGEMLYEEAPENSSRKRHARNVLTAATRGRALGSSSRSSPTAAARGENASRPTSGAW